MNRKRSTAAKRPTGNVITFKPQAPGSVDIEEHVRQILIQIGEDPNREGLVKTPYRVARAYEYLTKGYAQDPKEVVNKAMFTEDYQEMVLVKDIDFFSLCEHHLLPFFGRAHVAYIPKHRIVGLSKV